MKSSTNQIHSNPSYSIGKNYEYNRVAKVKKEKKNSKNNDDRSRNLNSL